MQVNLEVTCRLGALRFFQSWETSKLVNDNDQEDQRERDDAELTS